MQYVCAKTDQLALLGKPMDHEDIIEYILDGLDDDYRGIVEKINGMDVPPTLEELRDKLVNMEASILCLPPTQVFPMMVNIIMNKSKTINHAQQSYDNRHQSHSFCPRQFSNQ
ncbi:Retrovirus-related Pol polyprotein from transposon RE2 [Cardamine amara subsp. amara]|uniref:Retrovirus-related Pol polyprotein from transposon RE2 n=1 Tax=Cardamine amara subsp. amara TaxID=228776 RepID=A0ABD0ZV28_CARAN